MGEDLTERESEDTEKAEDTPLWKRDEYRSGLVAGCVLGLIISVLFSLWVMTMIGRALTP